MTINIQYERLPFNEAITEFIIGSLSALGEQYQWVTRAQVYFKKNEAAGGTGNICEIALNLAGAKLFASATGRNVELAAMESTQEIEKQLQKQIKRLTVA